MNANTKVELAALNQVDTLGNLLAQIAELTKQADAIKDGIKDSASLGGDKVIEGNLFKATYIETNRSSIDWLGMVAAKIGVEIAAKEDAKDSWKKVAIKLGFDADKELLKAIADNTKTTAVFSVKVTSR
jgi:hypothetical protein